MITLTTATKSTKTTYKTYLHNMQLWHESIDTGNSDSVVNHLSNYFDVVNHLTAYEHTGWTQNSNPYKFSFVKFHAKIFTHCWNINKSFVFTLHNQLIEAVRCTVSLVYPPHMTAGQESDCVYSKISARLWKVSIHTASRMVTRLAVSCRVSTYQVTYQVRSHLALFQNAGPEPEVRPRGLADISCP